MQRVNLTITDENLEFLQKLKDSGVAASLSHAARLVIQEYQRKHHGMVIAPKR